MNEIFELPISYKGEQLYLPTQLLQSGYVHQFKVEVEGYEILFEPDEEGNYRALVNESMLDRLKIKTGLLQEISEALSSL